MTSDYVAYGASGSERASDRVALFSIVNSYSEIRQFVVVLFFVPGGASQYITRCSLFRSRDGDTDDSITPIQTGWDRCTPLSHKLNVTGYMYSSISYVKRNNEIFATNRWSRSQKYSVLRHLVPSIVPSRTTDSGV